MQLCGYSLCPFDSHPKIKEIASIVLNTCGGEGVVRELLEEIFQLDFLEILYKK
jgi:3-deoxy-D-manno-octulosonate 8-phosphate phosphatase KdsC-like HAD superfamily phosphatase